MTMNKTLTYYNTHAHLFAADTIDVNFTATQDTFLQLLPSGAHILDFGCGSGRDTKYFLGHGMQVTAVDGSAELCRLASEHTGIPVKEMLFQDLDENGIYDGVWACSSILHLPKEELRDVFLRMARALKPSGYLYASFKYGTFEGERNGRYFTDFTEETFRTFITQNQNLKIQNQWITGDVRPGRENEKWLNIILQKQ